MSEESFSPLGCLGALLAVVIGLPIFFSAVEHLRTNNHAERIASVMTTIGFLQERQTVRGLKKRGWWPSDQPDRPKRRF